MGIFLAVQALCILGALHLNGGSDTIFALWFVPMGFFGGLWAVLITSACEQFGTNLRSTVTSVVPNFIRGSTVPLSFLFLTFKEQFGIVSCISFALALVGLKVIRESFGIPLSYIEVKSGQSVYEVANSELPVGAGAERHELPKVSGF
jgi:hypothetical protein